MPSDPQPTTAQPATPPEGVTFGDPVPAGVTFGEPTIAPVDTTPSWLQSTRQFGSDVDEGFKTALNQTGETAMRAIGAIVPDRFTPQGWKNSLAQTHDIAHQPVDSAGKVVGASLENVLEFLGGDEALKGLSSAMKIAEIARAERALKNAPVLTRMLGNAVRAQTVGTAVAAGHGASGGEAVATGAGTAVGGALLEGAMAGGSRLLKLIRPGTTEIMGEVVPKLASQEAGATDLAESVADIRSERKISAQQQEGGARAIKNRAQRVAAAELDKLNAARRLRWIEGEGEMNLAPQPQTPTAPPERQLAAGGERLPAGTAGEAPQLTAGEQPSGLARTDEVGAYEGDFPPEQPQGTRPSATPPQTTTPPTQRGQRVKFIEERPPNFNPIDTEAETAGINSFGDAAEKIREHAQPIFQRFDEATGGEYMRLRNLRDEGYKDGDYKVVRNAEQAIDDLFKNTRGKIDRTDYRAARSAWRTSRVLDSIHHYVSRAFNIPDAQIAQDAKLFRGMNGGILQRGLNRMMENYGRTAIEDVIGKDGVTGLYKLADLTQSPQRAALYGQKVGEVADSLIPADAVAPKAGLAKSIKRILLHRMAVSPSFASKIDFIVNNKIAPSVYAPLLGAELGMAIRGLDEDNQQPTIQTETVVPADQSRGVQQVDLPVLKEPSNAGSK